MIQEGVPAVSAAAAIDGGLVWSDGFGAADKTAGAITAALDGAPICLDEIMIGRQGYVHMVFHDGSIPTPLAARHPHRVSLKIRKRGDRLTGYVLTEGRPQTDRIGGALAIGSNCARQRSCEPGRRSFVMKRIMMKRFRRPPQDRRRRPDPQPAQAAAS